VSPPLIAAVDALYERAVTAPGDLDDVELGRWMEEVSLDLDRPPPAAIVRSLRKAARNARRLSRYWGSPGRDPARLPDWRNGVDEVLGATGWRPHLDLARHRLAVEPTPEAFEAVKTWFRAVRFVEWMEGVSFAEWMEEEGGTPGTGG
jgi:hypothetical protein